MAGLNKTLLIGNLTRDPEIRYSQQGTAVCNFSIATNETWRDQQGQKQERVEFHRIVVFGKQAETCEKYLSKGSQIYIEGRLQTRQYEKDGQTHYATEIVVSNFQFLGVGKSGTTSAPPRGQNQNQRPKNQNNRYDGGPNNPPIEDDIPF